MNSPQEIAKFIKQSIMGCAFVGITNGAEVFLEFDHDDPDLELGAGQRLRRKFPQITKVITVVKPSITQAQQMVEDLNQFLAEEKPKKRNLLDIESL